MYLSFLKYGDRYLAIICREADITAQTPLLDVCWANAIGDESGVNVRLIDPRYIHSKITTYTYMYIVRSAYVDVHTTDRCRDQG
jgi:hypothetical protein